MFYLFRQNNSSVTFDKTEYLDEYVIVEATDKEDLKEIVLDIGMYFNGVQSGIDCECCGDRWYWNDHFNKYNSLHEIFDIALSMRPNTVVIHYADGRLEKR